MSQIMKQDEPAIDIAGEFKRAAQSAIGQDNFELLHETYYPQASDPLVRKIISTYGRQLRPLERVMDCGAGVGYYSLKLHEWYGSEVIALDYAREACGCIRDWNRHINYSIQIVRGDMQQLPLKTSTVDWCFCMGESLCILSDPQVAVREMARVTRPNGGLLFSIVRPDHFLIRRVMRSWGFFHRIVPQDLPTWVADSCDLVLCQPRHYLNVEYLYRYIIHAPWRWLRPWSNPNARIARWLRRNGPKVVPVDSRPYTRLLFYPSEAEEKYRQSIIGELLMKLAQVCGIRNNMNLIMHKLSGVNPKYIKMKIDGIFRLIREKGYEIKKKKRIFVATWREGKNFGDDYLSLALTGYLKCKFPDAKIVQTNLHLDNYNPTINDILIIGGGGLWGPNGSGRLESRLYSAWMNVQSKLIIANIGIESFDSSSVEQLTGLCNKAELFSLRDKTSWLIVKKVLGENKAFWAADNSYLNPIQIKREPIKGCIGVNLCGSEQEDYRKSYSIDSIIKSISKLSKLGYNIRAVVFTYEGPLSDYKYCKQIDPTCSRYFSIAPYRNCELFIGMHFHSIILALQNCVPVIAINYSDKVKRVMQEYGLGAYCLEPEDSELFDKMLSLIRTMDKGDIISRIRERNESARQRLIPFENKLQLIVEKLNITGFKN